MLTIPCQLSLTHRTHTSLRSGLTNWGILGIKFQHSWIEIILGWVEQDELMLWFSVRQILTDLTYFSDKQMQVFIIPFTCVYILFAGLLSRDLLSVTSCLTITPNNFPGICMAKHPETAKPILNLNTLQTHFFPVHISTLCVWQVSWERRNAEKLFPVQFISSFMQSWLIKVWLVWKMKTKQSSQICFSQQVLGNWARIRKHYITIFF